MIISPGNGNYSGAEVWYGVHEIVYDAPAFNTHVKPIFDEYRIDKIEFTVTLLDYDYNDNPNKDCGFTLKMAYDNNNNNTANLIAAHGNVGVITNTTKAYV